MLGRQLTVLVQVRRSDAVVLVEPLTAAPAGVPVTGRPGRMTSMLAGSWLRLTTWRTVPGVKCTESYGRRVASWFSLVITSSPLTST